MGKRKITFVTIVVLFIMVFGLSSYIVYDKVFNNKDKQSDKPNIEDKNNDGDKNETSKYDKFVKWSTDIVYNYDNTVRYSLKDKKLICESSIKRICDVLGENNNNLVKVENFVDYDDYVYVLNENGDVYELFCEWGGSNCTSTKILDDYKIVNIAKGHDYKNYTTHVELDWSNFDNQLNGIFFLTDDNKLIDKNGDNYDENTDDFIDGYCFLFGNSYLDGYGATCFFPNDKGNINYMVHYKDGVNEFVLIKNKDNQNMIASEIYDYSDINYSLNNRKTLFVDNNKDLYEFKIVDKKPTIEYIGNVTSTSYDGEGLNASGQKKYKVSFNLSDGTTYVMNSLEPQYLDVKTNTLKNLSTING